MSIYCGQEDLQVSSSKTVIKSPTGKCQEVQSSLGESYQSLQYHQKRLKHSGKGHLQDQPDWEEKQKELQ